MRWAIALSLTLGGVAPASAGEGAAVGRPAPAFRVIDVGGAPLTLAAFAGKPLYVNIFASWCPPCRHELPAIVGAHARYAGRVTFLGVDAQEPRHVAERFARVEGIRYRIAIDRGQMEATYGAASIPESIFIDRGGTIREIVHGPIAPASLERGLALIAR